MKPEERAAQILSLTDVSPADRVGEFVSVNAYILQLFAPLSFLGTIYGVVIQAIIDMTNLSELLDITPDVDDDANATKLEVKQVAIGAKVEFKNVTFRYPSEESRGIENVSFVCEPGKKTAIVGHTGAGKTTILKMLIIQSQMNVYLSAHMNLALCVYQQLRGVVLIIFIIYFHFKIPKINLIFLMI